MSKINLPNTSSRYTDPSISPTGGKYRKWQGSDPRHHLNDWFDHDDLGAVVGDEINGKIRARTTGVSELRKEDKTDVGVKQGLAKKYNLI